MKTTHEPLDSQSESFLNLLAEEERIRSNRLSGVRTVLVVLSSRAMVLDREALRQKILMSYPEAAVFFYTTSGDPIGVTPPNKVDLLIDLTGPGQRQGLFFARKLKSSSKTSVGRNAGLFRKRLYTRIYDEKAQKDKLPADLLQRERQAQREVLALAGVTVAQRGELPPDRGKTIALELPSLQRL